MNKIVRTSIGRTSENKVYWIALVAVATLALPLVAQAQNGCSDSPENPTAVLAVVGAAGAFFANARMRLKARRKSSPK